MRIIIESEDEASVVETTRAEPFGRGVSTNGVDSERLDGEATANDAQVINAGSAPGSSHDQSSTSERKASTSDFVNIGAFSSR